MTKQFNKNFPILFHFQYRSICFCKMFFLFIYLYYISRGWYIWHESHSTMWPSEHTTYEKQTIYIYTNSNTNSAHCLSYRCYLKYETTNMFSCLCRCDLLSSGIETGFVVVNWPCERCAHRFCEWFGGCIYVHVCNMSVTFSLVEIFKQALKLNFIISQPKHMVWVAKRTV